jgi:hypothetical protein
MVSDNLRTLAPLLRLRACVKSLWQDLSGAAPGVSFVAIARVILTRVCTCACAWPRPPAHHVRAPINLTKLLCANAT